jgi:hypothetical protein
MKWKFTLSNAIEGSLVLADEPIGWADITLNIKRHPTWHGVFFEYAIDLKFYGEGYDYLRRIYDTQSREAYVSLQVEMQCADNSGYSDFYLGKLMMVKIVFDCQDDCIAEVPIEPAGCLMQFKNRIDQPVDLNANLDFDGAALTDYDNLPVEILLLPKAIMLRELADITDSASGVHIAEYDTPAQTIASGTGSQHVDFFDYLIIPTGTMTLNEVSANEVLVSSMVNSTVSIPLLMIAPFTANYNVDVNIPTLDFAAATSSSLLLATFYITVNGASVYSDTVISTTTPGRHVINNLHWNQDIFINQGDVLKVFIGFQVAANYERDLFSSYDVSIKYNDNNTLTPLSYDGRMYPEIDIIATILSDATNCNVYAINEALSRTVEAITNDCMRVKSDYFGRTDSQPYTSTEDGCGSLEVITKGLLIRNFPLSETIMAVSFKQIFDSMNSIHNIGIGIEPDTSRPGNDLVRVEPMEYFYDSTTLLTFDNVPAIKKTSKPEWDISTIEFGYDKWETENSMGLDEFCTKRNYRTTLKEIQREVSNMCKFIASGYSIEVTRQKQYIDESTTDFRYDNDIFVICVRRSGADLVVEQGIDCASSLTNIIDPDTIYNYRISPIRNFMRWVKSYMAAYFTDVNAANAKFVFTNGDGNFLVDGELITGCFAEDGSVAENADINVAKFLNANYAKPIFKNELDGFDYPLSLTDFNLIQANPRGTIKYRKLSTDTYSEGYIYNIQYKPNDGIATFNILPKY